MRDIVTCLCVYTLPSCYQFCCEYLTFRRAIALSFKAAKLKENMAYEMLTLGRQAALCDRLTGVLLWTGCFSYKIQEY